jgi:hypothetical protein
MSFLTKDGSLRFECKKVSQNNGKKVAFAKRQPGNNFKVEMERKGKILYWLMSVFPNTIFLQYMAVMLIKVCIFINSRLIFVISILLVSGVKY